MKYLITSLVFMTLLLPVVGQVSVEDILSLKEDSMMMYKPQVMSGKQVYLKMSYGSAIISNPEEITLLQGARIACVDLIFSDDPKGQAYTNLQRRRIENLKRLNPSLFMNTEIEWRLVRQTACSDMESAKALFHGIAITYRPAQTKEEISEEIDYLKEVLSSLKGTDASETGAVIAEEGKGICDTISYRGVSRYSDSTYYFVSIGGATISVTSDTSIGTLAYPTFGDSSVLEVLTRNKWSNMLIVADLTGSMSPYTAQLFVWLRLNTIDERVKQFVFFNDGDMTPDHRKIIGKTGGIYDSRTSRFEDVEELAFRTMRAGGGGDAPENDIEALIKAIDMCPECENIVLIADNWAPVKDISLMSNVKKPIKIILCGADYGINTQYLDLARATGGSLHTMKDDLTDLMKLHEGETIDIRGQLFIIDNGKFRRVTPS